jgi:hypothetical protein
MIHFYFRLTARWVLKVRFETNKKPTNPRGKTTLAYFSEAGSTTGGEASQLKGATGIFRTTPSAIKIIAIQTSGVLQSAWARGTGISPRRRHSRSHRKMRNPTIGSERM